MDTGPQHVPITTADAPFDDPTDSVDLVIRTADRVDFFVLSALLSLQSPSSFFRQVLPGNIDTEERDGFPVLEVEEDSDTFRTILLFCYPYVAPETRMESVLKFRAVGVTLDKYRMDRAMERFVQAGLASSMISEQPLRVFAVAVANGWKKLGEAAARNILATPFSQAISDVEELNEISARNFHRLEEYHMRCGKAAQIQVRRGSLSWLRGKTTGLFFLQKAPHYAALLRGHAWLTDTYFQLECGGEWNEFAGSQIRRFGKIVAEEIGMRVSKVRLDVEWPNKHHNEKDGTWDLIKIRKVFGMNSRGPLRSPPCNLFGSIARGGAKLRKFNREKPNHYESL
ncbi:hypothetical protein EV421DRAFT_1909086 [Armillaria borealis]|uniref:BTB domain-containing protein n=1 Tax=Armillaria borealis TaxID=47425 RepID=A0AA39J282_9AGAR|nr:hypothetical protein EV421DRAFT_1909086 [Armillaria borealis]